MKMLRIVLDQEKTDSVKIFVHGQGTMDRYLMTDKSIGKIATAIREAIAELEKDASAKAAAGSSTIVWKPLE